jgi:deoxyhypusine synthase
VSKIRSVVMEELARSQNSTTLAELEERLRLMADTIEAIQMKMLELSGRGLGHEALVSAAMASVENVNRLNSEEKVILTNIFRQNVAIQKPELVDSAIGQT